MRDHEADRDAADRAAIDFHRAGRDRAGAVDADRACGIDGGVIADPRRHRAGDREQRSTCGHADNAAADRNADRIVAGEVVQRIDGDGALCVHRDGAGDRIGHCSDLSEIPDDGLADAGHGVRHHGGAEAGDTRDRKRAIGEVMVDRSVRGDLHVAEATNRRRVGAVRSLEGRIVEVRGRSDHRARRAGVGDERHRAAERDETADRAGKSEQMNIVGQIRRDGEIIARAQSRDRDLLSDIGGRVRIDVDHRDPDPEPDGARADTAGKTGEVELLTRLHRERTGADHRARVDSGRRAADEGCRAGAGIDLVGRRVRCRCRAPRIGDPGIAGHQLMLRPGGTRRVDGDGAAGLGVFVGCGEPHLVGVVWIDNDKIGVSILQVVDRLAAAGRIDHGIAGLEATVGTEIDGVRGAVDGRRWIEGRRGRIIGLHPGGQRADRAVHE